MRALSGFAAGLVAWAGFSGTGLQAAAQEYLPSPSSPDSGGMGYAEEAARPHKPMVYIGPKGVFHLGNAPTEDGPGNRGIFKTYNKGGPLHWCNTFVQIRKADPHYWHYEMEEFSYEVAVARRPCCCGRYWVWVRNPVQGPKWHFYQLATRGPPLGQDQKTN